MATAQGTVHQPCVKALQARRCQTLNFSFPSFSLKSFVYLTTPRYHLLPPTNARRGGQRSCGVAGGCCSPQTTVCSNSSSIGSSSSNAGETTSTQVERITSKDNSYVKHCVKLRTSRKYRQQAGTVLLLGSTLLQEAAAASSSGEVHVRVLVVAEEEEEDAGGGGGGGGGDGSGDTLPFAGVRAERVVRVTVPVMQKLTGLMSADGVRVAAEVAVPPPADFCCDEGWPPGSLRRLLVLDGVQDPGNMGTLLRTAVALGWQGVYLLPGCCDPWNDKALRSSRGAAFRLPAASGSWQQLRPALERHGLRALAADPHATGGGDDGGGSGGGGREQQAAVRAGLLLPATASASSAQSGVSSGGVAAGGVSNGEEGGGGGGEVAELAARLESALEASSLCLVLGSEGQGLSADALAECEPVAIPMQHQRRQWPHDSGGSSSAGSGGSVGGAGGGGGGGSEGMAMESLNVGVAGAILMFVLSSGGSLPRLLASLL